MSLIFLLSSCSHSKNSPNTVGKTEKIIRSTHEERPKWTFNTTIPGGEHEFLYFVGVSQYKNTEQEVRKDAQRDAKNKISEYIGTEITSSSKEIKDTDSEHVKQVQKQVSKSVISQYEPKNWYIKKVMKQNGESKIAWKAFVRLAIPRKVVEKAIKKKKKDMEKRNKLLPDEKIRKLSFVSNNEDGKRINEKIRELLTNADVAIKVIRNKNNRTPHFKVNSKVFTYDQGKVGNVMESQRVEYTLTISIEDTAKETTVLETLGGNKSAIGTSDTAAKERAFKEIIEENKNNILEIIRNPEKQF
ncbi:MAG: hypothetical protein ABEH43_11795 [Flavobacteriales bacterium]